jgi:hypothetical protein
MLKLLDTREQASKEPGEEVVLQPILRTGLESLLVALIDKQEPTYPKVREGSKVNLFVNRMAAKTVPGTLVPIMKRALQDGDVHLLDIQTAKDDSYPLDFGADMPFRIHYAASGSLLKTARDATRVESDVIADWFRRVFSKLAEHYLPAEWRHCKSAILENGLGFDAPTFAYLLSLRATFKALMENGSNATVFVSPGRSVEAYCAQHMAGRRGVLSVEVVNAWLSDQYTYARPRGDIVTALDHWTAELLEKHFSIPPKCIRKLGTPRFDGVYVRAGEMQKAACQKALGIENQLPTVCVALQPIDLETNAEILRGVFGALSEDLAANVIIKPHPREEEHRLAAYQALADKYLAAEAGQSLLLPKANIIEALVASDICITAFSNVGVEAALCQRDTLLCQFDGMDVPVRLDEMGLGLAANSPEMLSKLLKGLLGGGAEQREIRRRRALFFEQNQHYLDGNAAEQIYALKEERELAGAAMQRELVLS